MSSACACAQYPAFQTWQGSELQLEFEVRESQEGLPLDLTGATAVCILKARADDPIESALVMLTTANGGVVNDTPYLGTLRAVFTGDTTASLEAHTYGCPWREYWSQFAVKLSNNQQVRSAVYKVTLWAGTQGPLVGMPGPGPISPGGIAFTPAIIAEPATVMTVGATETKIIDATFAMVRTGNSWVRITLQVGGAYAGANIPKGTEFLLHWRVEGCAQEIDSYHQKVQADFDSINGVSMTFLLPAAGGNVPIRIFGTSKTGSDFQVHPSNVTGADPTFVLIEDGGERA